MTKASDVAGGVLASAADIVLHERAQEYGDAGVQLAHIASLWSAYLSVNIEAHQVAHMMCLLKISRDKMNPQHPDNMIDAAGYAGLAEGVKNSRK